MKYVPHQKELNGIAQGFGDGYVNYWVGHAEDGQSSRDQFLRQTTKHNYKINKISKMLISIC